MPKIPPHGGLHFFNRNIKLDFSVNINPLGFPEGLKEYLFENINIIKNYPEIYSESLINELAKYFSVNKSNILAGNGSIQFIYLLPQALKIKNPLIVVPNFSEYEKIIKEFNIKISYFYLKERENFTLNIHRLIKTIQERNIDAVFICNPSNPCGNLIKSLKLKELIDFNSSKNIYTIIDEAFIDFTEDRGLISYRRKNLIILRSFTKNFGIPGLRLGICKSDRETISKIKKYLPPWSVNSLSLLAGKFFLKNREFLTKSKKFVKEEREFLKRELEKIKYLKIFDSTVNYFLIKILNETDAHSLQNFLIERGILIRNCANFRGLNKKFFRISVKKKEENLILIENLKKFFEENKE